MVTSIARQAIIIKSLDHTSGILGNYECAYCLGILSKAASLVKDDSYSDMIFWYKEVMEQLPDFKSEDERMAEVYHMMKNYEPVPTVDEQMKELYQMGYEENHLWQM